MLVGWVPESRQVWCIRYTAVLGPQAGVSPRFSGWWAVEDGRCTGALQRGVIHCCPSSPLHPFGRKALVAAGEPVCFPAVLNWGCPGQIKTQEEPEC